MKGDFKTCAKNSVGKGPIMQTAMVEMWELLT